MDSNTRMTRRQSYDAVLPKREKRCRLILETLGSREMTASEITEELVAAGRIPYFNRNYVAPRLTEMKQMGMQKAARQSAERLKMRAGYLLPHLLHPYRSRSAAISSSGKVILREDPPVPTVATNAAPDGTSTNASLSGS